MISVSRLSLRDFRSYEDLEIEFAPGLTAVVGDNGNGKTNLIEAIGFLARLRSFRGAPNEALVRVGAESAFVRGELVTGDRDVLIEVELPSQGRMRTQVNKQRLVRRADLGDVLTVTVFSPDDLELAKGGPGGRRTFLDDLLVDLHPKNELACADFAKVLKQRNALLKQMAGRRSADVEITLDVWDERLVEVGERMASLRAKLIDQLEPLVQTAYTEVAGTARTVTLAYAAPWRSEGLAASLERSRGDDIRRGVSTVGPHRDDLDLAIDGLSFRTHASQGEQRSLVLALRLGSHGLVTLARGEAPVLLLDDVFSELDERRSLSLLERLPVGQKIFTTAATLPPGARPDVVMRIANSRTTVIHPDDGGHPRS